MPLQLLEFDTAAGTMDPTQIRYDDLVSKN